MQTRRSVVLWIVVVGLLVLSSVQISFAQTLSDIANEFDWSSDGSKLAVVNNSGLRVIDSATNQVFFSINRDYLKLVRWSPDGRKLAYAAGYVTSINIIEVDTWEEQTLIRERALDISSITWSPDSRFLAVLFDYDKNDRPDSLDIIDVSTMEVVRQINPQLDEFGQFGPQNIVTRIAWSPTGSHIAAGTSAGEIILFVDQTGQKALTFLGHTIERSNAFHTVTQTLSINGISWRSDGSYLVSVDDEGFLKVWDMPSGQIYRELRLREGLLRDVSWHPSMDIILIYRFDALSVVDVQTLAIRDVATELVSAYGWSPFGQITYAPVTGGLQTITLPEYAITPTPIPTLTPFPTLPPTDLRALYAAYNSAPVTPVLHPSVVIRNHTNTPVPLSEVRLRYYFTRDGSADLQASCTFIPYYPSGVLPDIIPEPQPCADTVIVETGALSTPTATADSYLELRFTGGTLAANGYTVQYILSVNKADWSNFQQTNDYSYSAFGAYPLPEWDKITLTRQGAAVWGAAPN